MWVPGTGGRGGITAGGGGDDAMLRLQADTRVGETSAARFKGDGPGGSRGFRKRHWWAGCCGRDVPPPHAGSLPCLQQLVGARGCLCGAGWPVRGWEGWERGHRDPSSTRTHQVQSPGRNSSTCRYRTLSTIAPGVRPQPSGTAPLGHPWVAAPSGDRAAASSSSQGAP